MKVQCEEIKKTTTLHCCLPSWQENELCVCNLRTPEFKKLQIDWKSPKCMLLTDPSCFYSSSASSCRLQYPHMMKTSFHQFLCCCYTSYPTSYDHYFRVSVSTHVWQQRWTAAVSFSGAKTPPQLRTKILPVKIFRIKSIFRFSLESLTTWKVILAIINKIHWKYVYIIIYYQ